MNALDPQLFLSPEGKDNFRRLASVEYFGLLDAVNLLEMALTNGEQSGTGLTSSLYLKAQEQLARAHAANVMRISAQQLIIDDDEAYQTSEDEVKAKFASLRKSREQGLL